jgi:TatD DNase family protein
VIIHNRMAGGDVLTILRDKLPEAGGILHCFSENWEFAEEALSMNLMISFAGNVTFTSSHSLREVARLMPLDRMVIESEAPFIAPVPYQNQRNQLAFLPETLKCIASLRGVDPEEIAPVLYENSLRAFNLEEKSA